jgi:hypothetical protein
VATISLVSCAKSKEARPARAALLYNSPLFKKSLLYALSNSDRTYILSAKHGLLELDTVVAPYNVTLKDLDSGARAEWVTRVTEQIKGIIKPKDKVLFLAGREYSVGLTIALGEIGCRVEFPLGSLSLGKRLSLLTELNNEKLLLGTVTGFYSILKRLYVGQEGGRRLVDCSGKMDWPERGVYFFLDENDEAIVSGRRIGMPRVTRVGTHAVSAGSKTTLWDRLSTHRGTTEGLGSHRSSIFRLHLGRAHVSINPKMQIKSWGIGQMAPATTRLREAHLERTVSTLIGAMRVLWVGIQDLPTANSDRAFIERNSIGALSRQTVLKRNVSKNWLGNASPEYRIALSGLWNLNHLFVEPHEQFLAVLQHYVEIALGKKSPATVSLAPSNWNSVPVASESSTQLTMFDF